MITHDSHKSQHNLKPIRVLMVIRRFHPLIGGAERQAHRLANRLISKGIDVKVITGWTVWGTLRREIINGVPIFRNFTCWEMFNIRGLRKIGAYLYLVTLFLYLWRQRKEYDVIHIHILEYPAFSGVLAGLWLKKKSLIKLANSNRGSDIGKMQRNSPLPGSKQMLPVVLKADRFVAINQGIIRELKDAGVSEERIAVIPNGVDADQFVPKVDYKIVQNVVQLIFTGRLHTQKGLDVLLQAFSQVVKQKPEICWKLSLVGTGPLRSQLENMAYQLEIEQEVEFVGPVDDVTPYLAKADIFVLPSRSEGMSNALLEAMACALPCIATRISGNVDLIKESQNGILVPCEDTQALASAIIALAIDNKLRSDLGCAARQTVETQYSLDSVADHYIKLYDVLLNAE